MKKIYLYSKESELVIKNFHIKKLQDRCFAGKFYQILKEQITPIFINFQKTDEKEVLLSLFSESRTALMPKPDNDTIKNINLEVNILP